LGTIQSVIRKKKKQTKLYDLILIPYLFANIKTKKNTKILKHYILVYNLVVFGKINTGGKYGTVQIFRNDYNELKPDSGKKLRGD
jgi:hypothetical protein